ncbi:MAG: transcription initiation factor IIB family protein [Halorubrum sp.]
MASRDIYERTFDEDVQADANANQCPECGGHVTTNAVETVCGDCGLVLDSQPIDNGPEWRKFDDDETDSERTGAPLTPARHDRGLSTEIGRRTDGNGNTLSGQKRCQLGRLRREHNRGRWRSKAEQNLAHGLAETPPVSSALDLPESIRNQACALYRSATSEDLLRGRSIEAVAAASVYATCRCNALPRTLQEVGDVAKVAVERVEHAYGVLNRELGLPAMPTPPGAYVSRFASALGLSAGTRHRAEALAARATDEQLAQGCTPTGLAAACLYMAAQERCERVTQTDLAEVADVTPVTIRARWNELRTLVDDDGD